MALKNSASTAAGHLIVMARKGQVGGREVEIRCRQQPDALALGREAFFVPEKRSLRIALTARHKQHFKADGLLGAAARPVDKGIKAQVNRLGARVGRPRQSGPINFQGGRRPRLRSDFHDWPL